MAGLLKIAAFGLATSVGVAAFGAVTIPITENFNNDPSARGWSGVNNFSVDPDGAGPLLPNAYGFSNTDNTGTAVNPPGGTATAAGEAGGFINRGPNSFYGVSLGGAVNFADTDMNVRGVIRMLFPRANSTFAMGWSQGIDSVNDNSGNALYVSWDDGYNGGAPGLIARGDGGTNLGEAAAPNLSSGAHVDGGVLPFEYNWNAGTRTFSLTLGANPTSNLVLDEADVTALGNLTHWGMWSRTGNNPDDSRHEVYIDDITYTAVPEPASLGLLGLGSLLALRRRSK